MCQWKHGDIGLSVGADIQQDNSILFPKFRWWVSPWCIFHQQSPPCIVTCKQHSWPYCIRIFTWQQMSVFTLTKVCSFLSQVVKEKIPSLLFPWRCFSFPQLSVDYCAHGFHLSMSQEDSHSGISPLWVNLSQGLWPLTCQLSMVSFAGFFSSSLLPSFFFPAFLSPFLPPFFPSACLYFSSHMMWKSKLKLTHLSYFPSPFIHMLTWILKGV